MSSSNRWGRPDGILLADRPVAGYRTLSRWAFGRACPDPDTHLLVPGGPWLSKTETLLVLPMLRYVEKLLAVFPRCRSFDFHGDVGWTAALQGVRPLLVVAPWLRVSFSLVITVRRDFPNPLGSAASINCCWCSYGSPTACRIWRTHSPFLWPLPGLSSSVLRRVANLRGLSTDSTHKIRSTPCSHSSVNSLSWVTYWATIGSVILLSLNSAPGWLFLKAT